MSLSSREKKTLSSLTMYFVESFEKEGNGDAILELDWLTRDRSIIILGIASKVNVLINLSYFNIIIIIYDKTGHYKKCDY